MITKEQLQEVTRLALAADRAWHDELVRNFGKEAGDKRYTAAGKGSAGSLLRALHDANREACEAAHRAFTEYWRVN